MHELSVALEICRLAEREVGRGGLAEVRTVGVRVGDGAGLVPENLEFCLEVLLQEPPFADARPAIERCAGDVLRLEYLELEE